MENIGWVAIYLAQFVGVIVLIFRSEEHTSELQSH